MAALLWAQANPDFETVEARYLRANKPMPEELLPPEILPGFDSWYQAFFELGTERQFGGYTVGPIPRSAILSYTRGWKPGERDMFMSVIRALDHAYLNPETSGETSGDSLNPARDTFRTAMKRK